MFCCFNNNYKITPTMFDGWMRLLAKVEGSVLWLFEGNAAVSRNLRREAAARGIAPERLVFARRIAAGRAPGPASAGGPVSRYAAVQRPHHRQRCAVGGAAGADLPRHDLRRAGGGQPAARHRAARADHRSLPEYEALALRLATDPALLAGIRDRLARHRDRYPLFDTDRFRRHLEAAYVEMWERYQRGEPPASFAVAPLA